MPRSDDHKQFFYHRTMVLSSATVNNKSLTCDGVTMYAIRLVVVLSFVLPCSAITNGMASEDTNKDLILQVLNKAQGGVIVHLGCGDGSLTVALRTNDRFLVHGLDTNSAGVQRARENLLRAGDYGNVSVPVSFLGRRRVNLLERRTRHRRVRLYRAGSIHLSVSDNRGPPCNPRIPPR